MPRLTKRDAEALLAHYDADPVAALEHALQRLRGSDLGFDSIVAELCREGLIDVVRRDALVARDLGSLDALAAELNESRTLPS
jgi:hypothetical protein